MSLKSYQFLILEDSEPDAFLLRRHLSKLVDNVDFHIVADQSAYEAALTTVSPDVIFSDYRLPQYSGIEALMYARVHAPVVPFVFVTGALNNEELAADTILKGASGFVLKNNLSKLEQIVPNLLAAPVQSATKSSPKDRSVESPATAAQANSSTDSPSAEELMSRLASADPATLAEIQRLLSA